MTTEIHKCDQKTAEWSLCAIYVNDFSVEYNCVTHLMSLHNCHNWWDEKLRTEYRKQVTTTKNGNCVFEFGGYDYWATERKSEE